MSSVTGNTKMLAEEVRRVNGGEECVYFGTAGADVPESRTDLCGILDRQGETAAGEMTEFLEGLHGQKIFLFGTAGFGGSEEYFSRILDG